MRLIQKSICLAISALLFAPFFATAQINFSDALMYSQSNFGGTGRYQGIAGASVALGGDLGSAFMNPAGLGFNRRSEFSITMGLGSMNANADYKVFDPDLGGYRQIGSASDNRLNLTFPNLGVLFANNKNGLSGDFGGSFGISVSRINDFQNSVVYEGQNDQNQLVDFFLQQADGLPWGFFYDQEDFGPTNILGLAYVTYQIRDDISEDPGTQDTYYTFMPLPSEFPTTQRQEIQTTGAQYEWSFSYGGNFDDTFYYGIGLGIQTIRRSRERTYTESISEQNDVFDELVLNDFLDHTGIGVNLKGGLIYRPIDLIRVGLSFTSPTWFRMTESYSEEMVASYNNFQFFRGVDEQGNPVFETLTTEPGNGPALAIQEDITFAMRTPYRLSGGLAFFFSKNGFLSADVEYVGYGATRLSNPRFEIDGAPTDFDFEVDNQTISQLAENAVNIRVGGEYRVGEFRFRAGYAHYGDPYPTDDLGTAPRNFATGGVGLRKKDFYVDVTVVANLRERQYQPYPLFGDVDNGNGGTVFRDVAPTASVQENRIMGMVTFGSFF